jgi:hypothetical protein
LQGACPLAQNRGAAVEARTSYEAAEFLMLEGIEACHASRTGRPYLPRILSFVSSIMPSTLACEITSKSWRLSPLLMAISQRLATLKIGTFVSIGDEGSRAGWHPL